jgi:tagatose-1,6-bisphosphate aldolase
MSIDRSAKIVSANGVPVITLRLAPGSGGSTSEEAVARHPFQNTEDLTLMPWINPELRICSENIKHRR